MNLNRQSCRRAKSYSKKTRAQGFTLLEVMVVVVIIAIMAAAVASSGLFDQLDKSKLTRVKSDITNIETQLGIYNLNNFHYPSTDQGLEALVSKPSGSPEPKAWSQLYKKTPTDPWGNPYKYLSPGAHGAIDIYSWGADGRQSDDDIGNWSSEN